jgi:DNA adenine methylase
VLPRPFLKWAGGKRQLLPDILRHVPSGYDRLVEPFVGGGAVFFALAPGRSILNDANSRLVRTYRAIRDDVDALVDLLRTYPHEKGFFLELRGHDIDAATDVEVAAWMIYLNRSAFNGLYRVNSRGVFNVPFGRYANPTICDEENLRACSAALRNADVRCGDFEAVIDEAGSRDFVYCDPPYVPVSRTADFTSYTEGRFGDDDQVRLRDAALRAKARGALVLLSNSGTARVRDLYRKDFRVEEVSAIRAINSRADRRGAVVEILAS